MNRLDDLELFKKLDTQNMLAEIDGLHESVRGNASTAITRRLP